KSGLVPVKVDTWENFVFVNLDGQAAPLQDFLGKVPGIVRPLELSKKMKFFDRRVYTLQCNWKVYVDNYLDGGYHVPHAHKGLNSVIEYTKYIRSRTWNERACSRARFLLGRNPKAGCQRRGRAGRFICGSIRIS